jgi:predicted DNA-binding transcriptional regulator YafY
MPYSAKRPEPHDPFRHSLGVSSALPERIEIEFDARAADYIRERDWHLSQRLRDTADGSVVLTLDVGNDYAIRSWILSFGPLARVVSPHRARRPGPGGDRSGSRKVRAQDGFREPGSLVR